MNTVDIALARHHTYALFGRLYLEGVTAVTLPTLQSIPELAGTLPNTFDADEAAAEHQSLFGFNVFPYESIFLDETGLLGGAATDAALESYRQAGFPFGDNSASADHIGHELALLAHLCGAEAEALEDNLPLVTERMRGLQRDFLQSHLVRWLPPFVLAVKRQERPFYTALAALTLEFANDHGGAFRETPLEAPLPKPPNLLDNDKTSLKDIAEFLTTPPHSGIFLSRDDVGRLARQMDLPRGFGDRTQMLTNLMRTAAQYDTLPALLEAIRQHVVAWNNDYDQIALDYPTLIPFITPWQTRLQAAQQILHCIQEQIQTLA